MALLSIDRSSYDGAYAIDSIVTISAGQGSISIVTKVDGVAWVLNHFIAFTEDDDQIDSVPEWAFDHKVKLMDDIMRRGTIDTEHWVEVTTPVHMTFRHPSRLPGFLSWSR